ALPNTPCLTLAKILEDIELFMHVVDNLHFSKGARKIALHKGAPLSPLTPKEELILKLVKNGLKNPEIANELGISINTVKSHISRIFSKLHVDNRKDLTTGSIS
ncbi:MAG: helix-turn-helix domain-containing protein, partial [Clostridia bacterium]